MGWRCSSVARSCPTGPATGRPSSRTVLAPAASAAASGDTRAPESRQRQEGIPVTHLGGSSSSSSARRSTWLRPAVPAHPSPFQARRDDTFVDHVNAAGSRRAADRALTRGLNLQLRDVVSCRQLLQLLWPGFQPPAAATAAAAMAAVTVAPAANPALSAINIATAWTRVANMSRGQAAGGASRGGGGGNGGGVGAGERQAGNSGKEVEDGKAQPAEAEAEARAWVVRLLVHASSEAAEGMQFRSLCNTLWGMAKVRDELPPYGGGAKQKGGLAGLQSALTSLELRALQLLPPPAAAGTSTAAVDTADSSPQQASGSSDSTGGASDSARSSGSGAGVLPPGAPALQLQDAAQLWYGLGGLPKTWSQQLLTGLLEGTLQSLEALLDPESVPAGPAAAAAAGTRGAVGGGGGGIGGSGRSGAVESRTAAAQLVFRMGAQVGATLAPAHKARLAAVIDGLSLPPSPAAGPAAAPPLANPDCLLTGAHLMRLPLPPATVRRLHDAALASSSADAVRAGRVAMARALHSAVQLGLQPSGAEAQRWEQRLLEELGPGGGGGGIGGRGAWKPEELSWSMLALSGVHVYAPEGAAREALAGAVSGVLRRARANDATRLRAAVGAWGIRLPPRERAMLAQKAGDEIWEGEDEEEVEQRGGDGRGPWGSDGGRGGDGGGRWGSDGGRGGRGGARWGSNRGRGGGGGGRGDGGGGGGGGGRGGGGGGSSGRYGLGAWQR